MNAEQFLLSHNLDNVVLNANEFPESIPENFGEWVYVSDMMEKYTEQKLSEYKAKEANSDTLVELANPVDAKDISNYLNDFDNLFDTGFFNGRNTGEYAFYHKHMTMREFISKGREFIRVLCVIKKQAKK